MENSTLDPKLAAFVRLKIDVSATHMYAPGVRRHIKTAIELGATREELLEVIKLSAVIGIHACATGVPILAQELVHAGRQSAPPESVHPTPVCDALRAQNQFNPLWETLYNWDRDWLEKFLAMGAGIWRDNILPPLWIELLCIAGDAALTHMYSPGTRRHIATALALGADRAQIDEVLRIVAEQGQESYEFALPILEQELRNQAVGV
ncbi:carboxymuconolactone decarboxylase family protein [Rhodococcus opacus]|uniref:carboxymuconolactone decarboxylase family protein n=1 Tax=Rhodococcus opacus TaxID=37919 RepID=UPI001CED04E4|nr:carboxymuconolactone decarboxylase family protein [Rhodococcus opacus]